MLALCLSLPLDLPYCTTDWTPCGKLGVTCAHSKLMICQSPVPNLPARGNGLLSAWCN